LYSRYIYCNVYYSDDCFVCTKVSTVQDIEWFETRSTTLESRRWTVVDQLYSTIKSLKTKTLYITNVPEHDVEDCCW